MKPENLQQHCQDAGFNMPEGCAEQMANMKKRCGEMMGQWKGKRAICWTKTAENVLELSPGQTLLPEIWIQNGTHWPWKKDCFLGMDDTKEGDTEATALPIEMVNVPITQNVAGQEKFQMNVPIKAHDHWVGDDKVHEVHLSFRGPHGNTFGDRITFKVRIVAPVTQIDEM